MPVRRGAPGPSALLVAPVNLVCDENFVVMLSEVEASGRLWNRDRVGDDQMLRLRTQNGETGG